MDRNRIIALACGIAVFLLIIMAGKSCMQSPDKKSGNTNNTGTSHDDQYVIDYLGLQDNIPTKPKKYYDEFGRPADPPETEEIEQVEETVAVEILTAEPVTDIFGHIVEVPTEEQTEPIIEYATDIFGHIIEEATEPELESESENASEQSTFPDISGYNHSKNNDEEKVQEEPTLPPDFSIIIN